MEIIDIYKNCPGKERLDEYKEDAKMIERTIEKLSDVVTKGFQRNSEESKKTMKAIITTAVSIIIGLIGVIFVYVLV